MSLNRSLNERELRERILLCSRSRPVLALGGSRASESQSSPLSEVQPKAAAQAGG